MGVERLKGALRDRVTREERLSKRDAEAYSRLKRAFISGKGTQTVMMHLVELQRRRDFLLQGMIRASVCACSYTALSRIDKIPVVANFWKCAFCCLQVVHRIQLGRVVQTNRG